MQVSKILIRRVTLGTEFGNGSVIRTQVDRYQLDECWISVQFYSLSFLQGIFEVTNCAVVGL
jgi:hypothetical protein